MQVTECPACQTTFRVTDGQLRLAKGKVRCGHCLTVFNAQNPEVVTDTAAKITETELTDISAEIANEPIDTPPQLKAEPILLHREYKSSPSPIISAMLILLIATSGLLLAGQYLWFERATLANEIRLRPIYWYLCDQVDCQLSSKEGLKLLEVSDTIVRDHPRYSEMLEVRVRVENSSAFDQPYPALELSFKNLQGNLISRRTYEPNEYMSDSYSKTLRSKLPLEIELSVTKPADAIASYQAALAEPKTR